MVRLNIADKTQAELVKREGIACFIRRADGQMKL